MNRKWIPYLLILVFALALFVLKKYLPSNKSANDGNSQQVNRDRGFDRRVQYLKYSKHARCRMDCRQISEEEVKEIMRDGKINYNKSDLKNNRCPRYALEGYTDDQQRVRIVYAQCNETTTVVTVIDLGREWTCHCPGDDASISSSQKRFE